MECPWCAMELEPGTEVCPYCKERVVVGSRRRGSLFRLFALLALIGFTILLLGHAGQDLLRFLGIR
ncbi:hypothetical protein LLH00_00865 [bacterium]|nr:hypothetical protein [bacterium]